jgi:hypothetical protein
MTDANKTIAESTSRASVSAVHAGIRKFIEKPFRAA